MARASDEVRWACRPFLALATILVLGCGSTDDTAIPPPRSATDGSPDVPAVGPDADASDDTAVPDGPLHFDALSDTPADVPPDVMPDAVPQPTWTHHSLEERVGTFDIALDHTGAFHVLWNPNGTTIRYGRLRDLQWEVRETASSAAKVDRWTAPFISVHQSSARVHAGWGAGGTTAGLAERIVHAFRDDNGEWTTDTAFNNSEGCNHETGAIANDDTIHMIAFCTGTHGPLYRYRRAQDATWSDAALLDTFGAQQEVVGTMSNDREGRVHRQWSAFPGGNAVSYRYAPPGMTLLDSTSQDIPADPCRIPNIGGLAVDTQGSVHVVTHLWFGDVGPTVCGQINYAVGQPGSFAGPESPSNGPTQCGDFVRPSVAVTTSATVYVAWGEASADAGANGDQVKVSVRTESGWSPSTITHDAAIQPNINFVRAFAVGDDVFVFWRGSDHNLHVSILR